MANQKISELTAVTSPLPTDVLPIVNAGTTKKVALSGLTGVRMSGNGSLTSNQAAPVGVNSITFGYGALGKINAAAGASSSTDNIIIGCDSAKFKNCQGGSERVASNVFLGTGIASTYPDCATGSQPQYNTGTKGNVFIGTCAARDVFSYFSQNQGQCGTYTSDYTVSYNVAIGTSAALNRQKLCNNVIIGCGAHALTTLYNVNGNGMGRGTVAIGANAGSNNKYSTYNVFIGQSAGAFAGTCTVGMKNVGIGQNAFASRKDVRYSVAIGVRTLAGEGSPNTGGCVSGSIAMGWKSGARLVCSSGDVIIGSSTLGGRTYAPVGSLSASGNVILGNDAFGFTNVYGVANLMLRNNIVIGQCGAWRSRGSNNIMIGANTAQSDFAELMPLSGTIVLGNCAQPLANNTLVLGSATFPLSTVSTAGAAAGFIVVNINGTHRKIPFNA
jgi:hypothetical protein